MARLLSVNVGLPRDVAWRGQSVHTSIWKAPVAGRRMVRRLDVDGDRQGDLAGHGGEHRAVLVYQIASYRYWEGQLGRSGFTFGQFGENFTVEGLPDDEVCIGDRYRIGGALFEVTQPRVTCYRVGIRLDEPRMAALLVSHRRPGFYLRVLRWPGVDYDAPGHLTVAALEEAGVARDSDFYLCGPPAFLRELTSGLAGWGVGRDRIHAEVFGPGESMTPGIASVPAPPPHPPRGPPGPGPLVSFARSGLAVPWSPAFGSLLELAEACDVPVRWSCRTGVCHSCERGLVSGSVAYGPEPLDPPAPGSLLVCCSRPTGDVVIDL